MKIKIQNARLSFPALFRHEIYAGASTEKYASTFILDKEEHAVVIAQIQEAQKALASEKKLKVPAGKYALKDGDDSGYPELAGKMYIKASTKKRPVIIDRDKTPLVEDDGKPYAGCYVNAIISLWAQDNSYGKRINASLEGVQFYKDGEPFGAGGVSVDEFDDIEDFEDDDVPF